MIGADRITDYEPIYGNFPEDNTHGDTYGPLAYYAYVPFEFILPWSGSWDDLPAAHAAAIFFDLATIGGPLPAGPPPAPGIGGNPLGHDPGLRLDGLPLHGLRARVEHQRLPGRRSCS